MESAINTLNRVIWGGPVLIFILITGVALSFRSKFAQIRLLPKATKEFIHSLKEDSSEHNQTSSYRALCTALAATVGTGNIAGVAGAIAIGGPGAVFWMWISAILGMITKFAEVTLAVHYRMKHTNGVYMGGPMYMIEKGLSGKFRFLAHFYCFFGVVAALGVGNAAQVNAVMDSAKSIAQSLQFQFGRGESLLLGAVLAALIFHIFRSGSEKIGKSAEILVPFASVIYIIMAVLVLLLRYQVIPEVFSSIIMGAFSPRSVTGGTVGSAFLTLRVGISRGIFTNEAGMGTASIAHASSNAEHPVKQGLFGIMEVFLDTVIICTLTALVILCSGVNIPYGTDPGIGLTMEAFSNVLGNGSKLILGILASIFAFATILGWGLYGARCCQYLFGEHTWKCYSAVQACGVVIGAVLNTSTVWALSELVNGLMAIPNLIAVFMLSGVFLSVLAQYSKREKAYRLQ